MENCNCPSLGHDRNCFGIMFIHVLYILLGLQKWLPIDTSNQISCPNAREMLPDVYDCPICTLYLAVASPKAAAFAAALLLFRTYARSRNAPEGVIPSILRACPTDSGFVVLSTFFSCIESP